MKSNKPSSPKNLTETLSVDVDKNRGSITAVVTKEEKTPTTVKGDAATDGDHKSDSEENYGTVKTPPSRTARHQSHQRQPSLSYFDNNNSPSSGVLGFVSREKFERLEMELQDKEEHFLKAVSIGQELQYENEDLKYKVQEFGEKLKQYEKQTTVLKEHCETLDSELQQKNKITHTQNKEIDDLNRKIRTLQENITIVHNNNIKKNNKEIAVKQSQLQKKFEVTNDILLTERKELLKLKEQINKQTEDLELLDELKKENGYLKKDHTRLKQIM